MDDFEEWFKREYPLYGSHKNADTTLKQHLKSAWQAALAARQQEPVADFARECDDADKILAALGIPVEEARTEGGSLRVQYIIGKIKDNQDPMQDHIDGMLSSGLKCPLCARTEVHQHTPLEIIIYRNGMKYGRNQTARPPQDKQAELTEARVSETLQLFRREIDKNMDTRNHSVSPGHDAMRVALRHLFKTLNTANALPDTPGPAVGGAVSCPNGLTPDGPVCPRCGGNRGPSGVDGGSWVHYERRSGQERRIATRVSDLWRVGNIEKRVGKDQRKPK